MHHAIFRERLARGERLLGFSLVFPAAGIVECAARGWDFLWIDGQHGQLSYDQCLEAVRAADGIGVQTLLRVPSHDPGTIGQYADLMCSALMVPVVNNASEAAAVVDAACFPPLGNRSYGGRRPIDLYGRDYYRNHRPLLVCQIETPEAVENVDDIIATDGVDALMIGAEDLKIQLGLSVNMPTLESEPVIEALEHVARAARAAGKFAGCVAPTPTMLQRCTALGYQFLTGGSDVGLLRTAAAAQLATLRQALAESEDSQARPAIDSRP